MNTLKLGSVPYLNAKPLVAMLECRNSIGESPDARMAWMDLPEGEVPDVEIAEAVPSRLAVMLEQREVAAALVSSVVPLSDPSLCALAAGAVTSDGPVRSIRLLSRVPIDRIRRLALDASSRTSVVLCRVLLARVYGLRPEIVSMPPDVPAMLAEADAGLVIGDPALRTSVALERGEMPDVIQDLDLGSLWRSETGLPFVYAVWAAPRDGAAHRLGELLNRAATWGVARRVQIAEREAPLRGLPVDVCRRYVTENIRYGFGRREWDGLRLFHQYAAELGLLPDRANPLDCLEAANQEYNPVIVPTSQPVRSGGADAA